MFFKKKKKTKVYRPRFEERKINVRKATVRFECKSGVTCEEEVVGNFHQYYNVNNGNLSDVQVSDVVREADQLINTKGYSNTSKAPLHTVKDLNGVYHYRQRLIRAQITKVEDFEEVHKVCVGFDTFEIEE